MKHKVSSTLLAVASAPILTDLFDTPRVSTEDVTAWEAGAVLRIVSRGPDRADTWEALCLAPRLGHQYQQENRKKEPRCRMLTTTAIVPVLGYSCYHHGGQCTCLGSPFLRGEVEATWGRDLTTAPSLKEFQLDEAFLQRPPWFMRPGLPFQPK